MTQERHLWRKMDRASDLAVKLAKAAEDGSEDLPKLAKEAADRLIRQENQLGGFINMLLSRMAPAKAAVAMVKAGIDRNEQTFCWGVPPATSVAAEKAHQRFLKTGSYREI